MKREISEQGKRRTRKSNLKKLPIHDIPSFMRITFLGAAGTVTGSRYLLESQKTQILVDCGLFQGLKNLRIKNWARLPIRPKNLSAVVLTHAHLDHSGYIPRLVKDGFTGEVHCTRATRDLCKILLPDSGFIQEEDAGYANKEGFSKHSPALPLYTRREAEVSLRQLVRHDYSEPFEVGPFSIQFREAGHILGAANILISSQGKNILFSGDLGRPNDLLMNPPQTIQPTDYLVLESTYGDRNHSKTDPLSELAKIVKKSLTQRSVLLIPAFAVGRAQVILYALYRLFEKDPSLKLPVYINSPMTTSVTELYEDYLELHKMDRELCRSVCNLARFVRTAEESKNLNNKSGPMIIISASGMITGGRILHHMKEFAPDPNNILILPGFQAAGTRGSAILTGAKSVKIHGQYVPVNAEVFHLDLFSAHADQSEILSWIQPLKKSPPKKIFLVHGEPMAADTLRRRIEEEFQFNVRVVEFGEGFSL